ncbi:MAG: hypothetical protein RMK74_16795 [Myxococcales bacterium]|nr:hypothetical protein [Myxococcales bacterium]
MSGKTKTPLRRFLRGESALQNWVRDGMEAVKNGDREYFDQAVREDFEDSLDLDSALQAGHERENRWDYLLGHAPSKEVVAVELHSAKQNEISTVIKKRRGALEQLKVHLREGARISKWLWVAAGRVHFADTEKARRRLDQNGIEFIGKKVMARHMPAGKDGKGKAVRTAVRGIRRRRTRRGKSDNDCARKAFRQRGDERPIRR